MRRSTKPGIDSEFLNVKPYRLSWLRAYSVGITLAYSVFTGGLAAASGTGFSATARSVLGGQAAAAALFAVVRFARVGAFATERGIKIRNPLRTVWLTWPQIERFTLRPFWSHLAITAHAECTDGRAVGIWAIQRPNPLLFPNSRIAENLVDALNDELRTALGAEPPRLS